MENIHLTDTQHWVNVFQQGILDNLQYWQTWFKNNQTDVEAIDRERNCIITAISFALDLGGASWSNSQELIEAFSPYIERRGYGDRWSHILERAVHTAHKLADKVSEVKLTILLARLTYRQGHFQDTITNYCRAIRIARQIGDAENRARAYSNLGYLYVELDHWWRAEILCCGALIIFEELDHDHGRAHTENHIGRLYIRQQLWDKAKRHLEHACAIWQATGDRHGLMRGFINLGSLYGEKGAFDKSLYYLKKAEHQAGLTGERSELGAIYENMGVAYRLKGEAAKAEKYLWQAEKIFRHSADTVKLTRLWHNLGMACVGQDKWQEGMAYLKTALDMSHTSNNKDDEIRILMDIVECELIRKNWPKAAAGLSSLEGLIARHSQGERRRHLEEELEKHRHSLAEYSSKQAATD